MREHANITRHFQVTLEQRLSTFVPLIQVLCGPRQIGKTTAVKQILGKVPEKSLYLTFDTPRPDPHEYLRFEWARLQRIKGHKIIVLDEIQNVPNWGSLLKELYDEVRGQREVSVVVLGSSALELLLRGEESLFGRYEIIRAPHWNAQEMFECFGWDLATYLKFGGYPILGEIYNTSRDPEERCQGFIRDAIIEPVITRDIFTLQNVLHTGLFRQILKLCFSLPCRDISYAKLGGQISEKGSSATIKNYVDLLEKSFLVKLLTRYSGSVIRKRTSSPKIVPLAPALIHSFQDPHQIGEDPVWFGDVFEAAVISRISETRSDLYYWSDSRVDVDLVIEDSKFLCAVEIKSNKSVDFRGLRAFKGQYPNAKTVIIDRDRGEELLYSEDPRETLLKWMKG
jgi:predicted AAA+ superfamily ATPase